MSNDGRLAGRRVLIVEDDFSIADAVAGLFRLWGAQVIGPVASVKDALTHIAAGEHIDGAVLDVNLNGKNVYPVADLLHSRGVRIVFMSGYDSVDARYAHIPCLQKPMNFARLVEALFS
jgi:DNA-binding NtrC family response regulator